MDDADLAPGETLIAEWRPQLSVFLGKLAFVTAVTALILSPLLFGFGLRSWLIAMPLSLVLYLLAFDDHREWLRRRRDLWRLTSRRLIYANPDDPASPAHVALSDIRRVRLWMWWALLIELANGQTTRISFAAAPGRMKAQILAARDAADG